MTSTRNTGKRISDLRNITPAQVDALTAWEQDDPRGLAEVVALIGTTCDRAGDDPEVAGFAAIIVGGYRTGARSDAHAAMAAVVRARKTVRAARALAEWAGEEGDLVESVTGDPDARGTVARYAPAPDAVASWHPVDVVETFASQDVALRAAVDGWRAHERILTLARETGTVAACGCGDHLAHRVTLAGVLAHLDGLTKDESGFWSSYRATRKATAHAGETFAREGLAGDPAPFAPAHAHTARATGGDRTPQTRDLALTVTLADGSTRDLTPVEARQITGRLLAHAGPTCAGDTCAHGSCQGIRSDLLTRAARRPDHGGEWGKVTTAPAHAGDRRDNGQVRAFPTVVSPRKKARTGSTGPTTRAW